MNIPSKYVDQFIILTIKRLKYYVNFSCSNTFLGKLEEDTVDKSNLKTIHQQ